MEWKYLIGGLIVGAIAAMIVSSKQSSSSSG